MAVSESDEIAGALYLVPPARFVATRDELVRKARAAGDRALAEELRALRRPTQSAWLVNVLTRHERALIQRLFDVGRELRNAQTRLDAEQLRRLSVDRQRLIADLLGRARRRAADAGVRPSNAVLGEVEQTLRAALVDLAASATVLAGRLIRPMFHSGFGPMPHLETPIGPQAVPVAAEGGVREHDSEWIAWPVEDESKWSYWPVDGGLRKRPARPSAGMQLATDPALRSADQQLGRANEQLAAAEAELAARQAELVEAEEAAAAARERLEWLDRQQTEARREQTATQRHLGQAQSAERAARGAVAAAQRDLAAAERGRRPAHGEQGDA